MSLIQARQHQAPHDPFCPSYPSVELLESLHGFRPKCFVPWQEMIIGADGNVSPCSYYQGYGATGPFIGNVNEQSILEIWNGQGYRRLRAFFLSTAGQNGCPDCLAVKQELIGYPRLPSQELSEQYPNSTAVKNVKQVLQEIHERKSFIQSKPGRISYTPSQQCNFQCTMCYQAYHRNLTLKDRERVDREFFDLIPFMIEVIAGGGEPFLLPIWHNFVKSYTSDMNPVLCFSTTTNGSLITDQLLDYFQKFPKVWINFSIDASRKELYERIRKGSSYEKVFDNLLKVLDRRKQSNATLFQVSACMTIMKSNVADLTNMLRFMLKHQLPLVLSPLNVFPLDESLICYNNIHEELSVICREIDRARDFILSRIGANLRDFNSFENSFPYFYGYLRNAIKAIKEMVPCDLRDAPHYKVVGHVPGFVYCYDDLVNVV